MVAIQVARYFLVGLLFEFSPVLTGVLLCTFLVIGPVGSIIQRFSPDDDADESTDPPLDMPSNKAALVAGFSLGPHSPIVGMLHRLDQQLLEDADDSAFYTALAQEEALPEETDEAAKVRL